MVNHTHAEPGNTFHESRTAQVGISRCHSGIDAFRRTLKHRHLTIYLLRRLETKLLHTRYRILHIFRSYFSIFLKLIDRILKVKGIFLSILSQIFLDFERNSQSL